MIARTKEALMEKAVEKNILCGYQGEWNKRANTLSCHACGIHMALGPTRGI